jgi:hypothetical protein
VYIMVVADAEEQQQRASEMFSSTAKDRFDILPIRVSTDNLAHTKTLMGTLEQLQQRETVKRLAYVVLNAHGIAQFDQSPWTRDK